MGKRNLLTETMTVQEVGNRNVERRREYGRRYRLKKKAEAEDHQKNIIISALIATLTAIQRKRYRQEYQRQYYQDHKEEAKAYQRIYNLQHKKKRGPQDNRKRHFTRSREAVTSYNTHTYMELHDDKIARITNQIIAGERTFTM